MGGGDEPSNLVRVTEEQHAELHLALYLEHGFLEDWKGCWGLYAMSQKTDEEVADIYRRKGIQSPETKKRMREYRSTLRHWFKGDEARFSAECPGEGWQEGRKPGSLAHGNHNNKVPKTHEHSSGA